MSDNKSARRELEKVFGQICMIEQLGIRNIPKRERRKIKGYTKYDDVITYHHIKEKQYGGKATFENGALLRGYNHRWLHSLTEEQKEQINNSIIEFKTTVLQVTGKGLQAEGQSLQLDFNITDYIEIPVFDNKQLEDKKKFNRAKEKHELRKQIDEALYKYENSKEDER